MPRRVASLLPLPLLLLLLTACSDGTSPEVPSPPARLIALSASAEGVVGEALPEAPSVRVVDAEGRPVSGATVRFTVTLGSGSLSGDLVDADADGVARLGAWTLGSELGTQELLAAVEDAPTVRVKLRATAGWRWTLLADPLGVKHFSGLQIHPLDDDTWYAFNLQEGLSLTRDGGSTWSRPLWESGLNDHGLKVDPQHPDTVWAGVRSQLFVSGDRGETWELRHSFEWDLWIRSVEVLADGTLVVGPQWPAGRTPGVLRSEDRGATWTHHPFGTGDGQQFLPWVLREDPATGILWAGIEIADHPEPYRPPFLRSVDGGRTWVDWTDRLPFQPRTWHLLDVVPAGGRLFALSEGAGVFRSLDGGNTWRNLGPAFAGSILADARLPRVVFGGDLVRDQRGGTVQVSLDGGSTFQTLAQVGHSVAALELVDGGRRMVVASWGGGLRVVEIPASVTGLQPAPVLPHPRQR